LLKVQHPETELAGLGMHATLGVSCADCHMPKVAEQGFTISDHWIRSPLLQLEAACLGCHRRGTASSLEARVVAIQDATVALSATAEHEIASLLDAIVAVRTSGSGADVLAPAQLAHRRAQFRWDFIDAENSTGFHASEEAQRLLLDAAELARAGRVALESRATTVP
jgi:nitrite reductase (cytochrome c-552)